MTLHLSEVLSGLDNEEILVVGVLIGFLAWFIGAILISLLGDYIMKRRSREDRLERMLEDYESGNLGKRKGD